MTLLISKVFQYMSLPRYEQVDGLGEPWIEHSSDDGREDAELHSTPSTRLAVRTRTFPDPPTKHQGLNMTAELYYQKRSGSEAGNEWVDPDKYSTPSNLKIGDCIKVRLDADQLQQLFAVIAKRYAELGGIDRLLTEAGINTFDPNSATLLEGRERDTLKSLMAHDADFWRHLEQLDTRDTLTTLAHQRQHQARSAVLDEFERRLDDPDWDEAAWDQFFCENEWIFGLGLRYQYLGMIRRQANLGGTDITGRGADKLDALMTTNAERKFTVLVEIKKPVSKLLATGPYRDPNIYRASKELSGGVSQVQVYCDTWTTQGSRNPDLVRDLDSRTYAPKGLLVIGRLNQLENHHMIRTFELFRRQIHNPEIVTFDELLERARYINSAPETECDPPSEATSAVSIDDLPF